MTGPREAAATNANVLATENRAWRHTFALGFAAVTFALLDLADAVREQA